MPTPQQALKQYFGFDHFREGQEETIQRVLNGQHTLLVMPTGSGKSLTYQLPALLQPGLTLVLSPLIALMKDQVDSLVEAGVPATYINSSLPNHEVNRRTRAMLEGQVKLLYVAPERLRNRAFTKALAKTKIGLLAVDEAHCISQWGHDFRPDYLQIGPMWQAMGQPTLLATTATATPTVQKDIIKLLGLKNAQTTVTGFNRPNLTFRVVFAPEARTKLQTLQLLLGKVEGSAIVYCATRRNTDEVADFINDVLGFPARAYHAGLDRDTRYQVQTDFMADRFKIVVATNAFGMGVDKPDVRSIIHYNMPGNVEAYYQEAGRAGRDDRPAECVLLFAPDDLRLQQWLINSDTPTHDDLHQVYTRLSQAANEGEVYFSTQELSQITGLHPVKIRVTLNELEQAGVIYHMGDQSGYGHWKVLPPSDEALRERAAAIQRRANIRLDLLDTILDYVHLTTCRREFLLKYFGDTSPPRSAHCCDNHTADTLEDLPKAVTPQEWFPLIILETVRSFQQRPVGRNRLAQILNGSRAKDIGQFGYDKHKFYGKLSALSQPQIITLIDALISGRYLRLSGSELPVLTLTEFGLKALEARAALPITVPGLAIPGDGDVERWQRSSARSDTVMETFNLFQQGLTPDQIAAKRELAEGTIYTHLARLIGEGKIELNDVVPPEIEAQILKAAETVGNTAALSPLKAVLPDEISYGHIKCVLAARPELPKESQLIPRATPPPSPPAQTDAAPDAIILDAVTRLGGSLGRTGLAQFLSGSRAGWLEAFFEHSAYGQLSHLSQQAIINIIDALITDGKLKTTGGHRPKVVLSEQPDTLPAAGTSQAKSCAEEQPEPEETPPTHQSQPSLPPDSPLLETLRAWRTEQARAQQMPPYIIFSNKVLEAIAAQQPTTLEALANISGIGPAKLAQYGEAVIAIITGTETQDTGPQPPATTSLSPPHQLKEAPQDQPETPTPKLETQDPTEAITAVVSDLDGLLTCETLAQLLVAGPEEIVSFSDHALFSAFHGQLSFDEVTAHIEEAVQSGQLSLSPHRRLTLP